MVDSITERARPVSLAAASDARARLDHDIRGSPNLVLSAIM
jgi:hypothetical protein